MKDHQKNIKNLFGILFILVPLILWPFTSELFEFNKMVITYIFTTLIVAFWIIRSIQFNKFIFRRTILDIPLIIFFFGQLISTIISIDPQTSWLGYYSRFNGGLLSTICYLLLYWAFVSNIKSTDIKKLLRINLITAAIVSTYGILERLGIDKNIWQQDVQHRVFSTLGQPNWLAAWLVALIPITWANTLSAKSQKFTFDKIIPYLASSLFFAVLLFTGSRSGLLGFAICGIVFWGVVFIKFKLKYFKSFLVINAIIAFWAMLFGTQLTPSIFKIIEKNQRVEAPVTNQSTGTALETGGTESGVIRKIVWQGAVDIWKHYPIFGTGVETFAYSYFMYRPAIHNQTSEWDFIYNKAHNEYLNFLANSGLVGLLSYLTLIFFSIYMMIKNINHCDDNEDLQPLSIAAFIAGYFSILVTNFFGFSVVPIQIVFYLFPAFSFVLSHSENEPEEKDFRLKNQKAVFWIMILMSVSIIYIICRYWYADILYAKGVNYNKVNRQDLSYGFLTKAINLQPKQSIYYSEQAKAFTGLALAYAQAGDASTSSQLSQTAVNYAAQSVELSAANLNNKRNEFGVLIMLSTVNPSYQVKAVDVLIEAVKQAPTDAKIFYNLGLLYTRLGQNELALDTLKKTVDLKPNYKDAHLAYAMLLIDAKKYSEAKTQLEYILKNIDPEDSLTKQYLESIN